MEGRFDWHQPAHVQGRESFLPPPDRIGWWMVVSLLVAIVLHIILFVALGHIRMGFGWTSTEEVYTEPVVVRPVEDDTPFEESTTPPEETEVPEVKGELVDDIEILEQLKDPELTMKPDVDVAAFDVDIKMEAPAATGIPEGDLASAAAAMEISAEEMDSLGKTETITPTAAEGQMIVDPGSELSEADNLDSFMAELIKKGNNGKAPEGRLDGTSSLDEIAGLPENVLINKTTMLPGDLLFEFNSDRLREGSKVGMLKIALVMDRNPNLYCWIDGHTDLVGGDAFNYDLSRRRAEAVKSYLVGIGMPAQKIITRGMGKTTPIVLQGNQDEQSINRRVEIKMRKTPPPEGEAIKVSPLKALPVPEMTEPAPPKAKPILVKPKRALPVQEEVEPTPPQAKPVMEDPPPPRAAAVEEEEVDVPPPARVIEETPPLRAQAVEE